MEDRDELELRRAFNTLRLEEPPTHTHAGDIIFAARQIRRRRRKRRLIAAATVLGVAVLPATAGIATSLQTSKSDVVTATASQPNMPRTTTSPVDPDPETIDGGGEVSKEALDMPAPPNSVIIFGINLGRRPGSGFISGYLAGGYAVRSGPGLESPQVARTGDIMLDNIEAHFACFVVSAGELSADADTSNLWVRLHSPWSGGYVNINGVMSAEGQIPSCPAA